MRSVKVNVYEKDEVETFRSGYIALCGRPNVGKSSLLNRLLEVDVAIATKFPQTTREAQLAIWTTAEFQAVLVDTPGIHRARGIFNQWMVKEALRGAKTVDLILMLAEVPQMIGKSTSQIEKWQPGEGAMMVLRSLAQLGPPVALVLTKCDRATQRSDLAVTAQHWSKHFKFCSILCTSARTGEGLEDLRSLVRSFLPEQPALFSQDELSNRSMRWHAAERVRKALFLHLSQELPYLCAVTIEVYKELQQPAKDHIRATIHVERNSQKGIVVGKAGTMIRAISITARREIEKFTGRECELFLTVKVSPNWTKDAQLMEQLGFHHAVSGES